MTPCFLYAFREHLDSQRHLRQSRNAHLVGTMVYSVGNVGVSKPVRGVYVVWRQTPKCGWLRVVSEWRCADAAKYSASLLFLRLRREDLLRYVERPKTLHNEESTTGKDE